MTRSAVLSAITAICAAVVQPARAQDSQFGIRGLGTPGRWESVRARTTGGAFGPFDPMSPLTEAALVDAGRLTATAMEGTSYRRVDVAGSSTALRASRFPLMGLAGAVTRRLSVGGGFSTYLDKSYAITLRDTIDLRGTPQPYTDEISSSGGVADVRLAAASRVAKRLALGVAIHLLTGSMRMTAERRFDDTTFHAIQQADEVRYDGFGVSGSALIDLTSGLRLAAFLRSDGRLRARVGEAVPARTDLPVTLGAGLRWAASPSARVAATLAWRSWSRAGSGSFNTVSWSAGAELGSGFSPVRFGVRAGQLPFGPGANAPTEWGIAAGSGKSFAQGHAQLDFGVDRLERKGSGLTERTWTFLVGLTVRP